MYATQTIRQALRVAATAHRNQVRKGRDVPYIVHPVGVALILAEYTDDDVTLAAALLHDVLEDCSDVYSEAQMREDFGDEITNTVKAVSKDSSISNWRARNEAYIKNLKASNNTRAFMVCVADKINNLTDTLEDQEVQTPKAWEKFNAGKEDQLWFYSSVYKMIAEKMPGHPLTKALDKLVDQLALIVMD